MNLIKTPSLQHVKSGYIFALSNSFVRKWEPIILSIFFACVYVICVFACSHVWVR